MKQHPAPVGEVTSQLPPFPVTAVTLKRSVEELATTRNLAQAIVETAREPLVVLDADLRVRSANQAFYAVFQVTAEETLGCYLHGLGDGQWNLPALHAVLQEILSQDREVNDFEVDHDFPRVGRKRMLLNARRLSRDGKKIEMILLMMREIQRDTPAA